MVIIDLGMSACHFEGSLHKYHLYTISQSAAHLAAIVDILVCWVRDHCQTSFLNWPIHSILARTQIGYRVLHCWISKVGMLLGLKSQGGQAGVAGVSVHVGTGCAGVGACGCSHGY